MPATYEPIATTTVSNSTTSTITFSSIVGTYTDLVLVTAGTASNTGNNALKMTFNSDTSTNYSFTFMYGDGANAASGRSSNASFIAVGRATSTQGNGITHIQNYSNTTTNKTAISRGNVASNMAIAYVGLWRSTAAITSISLTPESATYFDNGYVATLYGIKAA